MILPYVYKLTHKETKQFYIGYREANKLPSHIDLPKYQTSSTTVKNIGFNNFDWEIIAEFFNPDDAYDFENEYIKEYIDDELCLNEFYRDTQFGKARFKHTGGNSITRRAWSEETRLKMRAIHQSDEFKEKMRVALSNTVAGRPKGQVSEEALSNMREVFKSEEYRSKLRKPKSEEHKAKLSAARKAYLARKKAE